MPSQQPHQQQHKTLKSGTWLPAEDHRLSEAVAQYGNRWVSVASKVETRNGDQCAKRWNEHLNPELDRSPWTAEEASISDSSDVGDHSEERLLNLVERYGHNWKPIASKFFESRAPLALKNKHSLLMRRLKRRGPDQQPLTRRSQQDIAARHAARPRNSSSVASPPAAGAVEQLDFFAGSCPLDFSPCDMAGNNGSLPIISSVVSKDCTRDVAMTNFGQDTLPRTTAAMTTASRSWNDQNLAWQQHPILGNGIEFGSILSAFETNVCHGVFEKGLVVSDNGNHNHGVLQTQSTREQQSAATSDDGDSYDSLTSEVEYSVTCQRGKLKTLLNHFVEAAMSESASRATENDNVTVTLRLRK